MTSSCFSSLQKDSNAGGIEMEIQIGVHLSTDERDISMYWY